MMNRVKLKEYQTSYGEVMRKFGLKRGVDGSQARHIPASEFYRDVFLKQGAIQKQAADMERLKEEAKAEYEAVSRQAAEKSAELSDARKELKQVRREIGTDRLKSAAVQTTTRAVQKLGDLLYDPKPARYEQQIKELEKENADFQLRIVTLTASYKKETDALREENKKQKREQEEIEDFFPHLKHWLTWAGFLRRVGFALKMVRELFSFRPLRFRGSLYSHEFNRYYETTGSVARLSHPPGNPEELSFTIDGQDHIQWFRNKDREFYNQLGMKMQEGKGLKV